MAKCLKDISSNGTGLVKLTGLVLVFGLEQGCPTFLSNEPHCKLKYVTAPQNHQNSSVPWKMLNTSNHYLDRN